MPTIQELQKQIDGLQQQIDMLKNYSTIPFDVGEAMKFRILGQNKIATAIIGSTIPATTNVFVPPSTNYTVGAPLVGSVVLDFGNGITRTIPTLD